MSRIKLILVYILLIANLSSGLAFAWDTHPEAIVGHDSTAVEQLAGDHDHPDDHCCHGAAHLLGVFTTVSTPTNEKMVSYLFSMMTALPSLYITPLLRPPIV